ncbi:MAG: glycosyltransferase family 2 protein [Ginsengibacter sp.]
MLIIFLQTYSTWINEVINFLQGFIVRCIILLDKKISILNYFSIVIITKNEEHVLERTLASIQGITDDVIIVDSGSTDGTLEIAKKYETRILQTEWTGYGATKNSGIAISKYNWILSLDADEAIDGKLKQSLSDSSIYNDPHILYDLYFKSFIGKKEMQYGQWLRNHHIRLFNKTKIAWNTFLVHEKLNVPGGYKVKKLQGHVLHYTMGNFNEFINKLNKYALLSAEKYFISGKKCSWYKLYLTPGFTFFTNYLFKLGFLDGWYGLVSAKLSAYYSFLKYAYLKEMQTNAKDKNG